MGKQVAFLSILIFADLFFIATGQICASGTCSITSIIFNAILNLGELPLTTLFNELIGNSLSLFSSSVGIASLVATGGVTIAAFITSKEFRILLIPIAFTLALIAGDFVIISTYLVSLNPLLGTLIMGPLAIMYVFVVVEWLIGKD